MNISIRRILLPTDFSQPAKEAQQYAMALADRLGAELHLLHVAPIVMPYADASSSWIMPENVMQEQIEAADEHLGREVDAEWAARHHVKHTAVAGFAVDEILKYATEQQIDLIVVGTHGRSGLSHFVIGSVAEKLVRMANCPVLTVHPQGHQFLIDTAAAQSAQMTV